MALFTSPQLQMISTGMGFMQSYNNARTAKAQGETDKFMRGIEADQLLASATLRMNQGVREAENESYKGRLVHGEAVSEMAASGAEVDPLLLAKLKQRADHNTMTAIYDAQIAASDIKYRAAMTRIQGDADLQYGKTRADDIMLGAYSTAVSKWPRSAAQRVGPGAAPTHGVGTYRKSTGTNKYTGGF